MSKRPGSGRKITQVMQQIARKKRLRQLVLFVILVVIIVIFVTGPRGTYQLYKFTTQKKELKKEIINLESEKSDLEQVKNKIENDPEYIEKVAREKYKMKKKDEKVYEIMEEE
jgi:cell division protein FtsL